MMQTTLFLAIVVLLKYTVENDILSKFQQNGYKMKGLRLELIRYNEDYVNTFYIKAFKYNRTTTAHNITVNFKTDIESDKAEAVVQVNKFISNEYRHFPMRMQINIQKILDANAIGLAAIKDCGNLTSVNFKKELTYFACNFVIDETRFPPLIPNGNYRGEILMLYSGVEFALIHNYAEIYTPVIPKN